MKHIWKKIAGLMMTVAVVFSFAGCGKTEETGFQLITDDMIQSCESGSESFVQSLASYDRATLETLLTEREAFARIVGEVWLEGLDEFGALQSTGEITTTVDRDENEVRVEVESFFEKKEGITTVVFDYDEDSDYMMPAYITLAEKETFGGNMRGAAINTVMGVGTVFVVLVFLVFVISLFKYVGKIGQKKPEAPKAAPKAAPAPVAPAAVEEDVTDDLELMAVIAAAIAASENTSTDGFVVRSIKKVNRSKWQRA